MNIRLSILWLLLSKFDDRSLVRARIEGHAGDRSGARSNLGELLKGCNGELLKGCIGELLNGRKD